VRLILFISIVVLTGSAGDIAITRAMKKIGEIEVFSLSSVGSALDRAFRMGWMWIGISLMTIAFFSLLALLSWGDVSVVVPATALSYVVGAFGAKFLLNEQVTPVRWAGVVMVCIGVAFLSIS
jgi:drug/metabolite transporter (DMT)-like permease